MRDIINIVGIATIFAIFFALSMKLWDWFTRKDYKEPINEIDGFKIMTVEEIVKDNVAFIDMETVVRYLYSKDKARDTVKRIDF